MRTRTHATTPQTLPWHDLAQLQRDALTAQSIAATALIRRRRECWEASLVTAQADIECLFDETDNLRDLAGARSTAARQARRYLNPWALSADDQLLITKHTGSADVPGWAEMTADEQAAAVLYADLDRSLYPWLDGPAPTCADLDIAKAAIAGRRARQIAETKLRKLVSDPQQHALEAAARDAGFVHTAHKGQVTCADDLEPGQCTPGERKAGVTHNATKADHVVRLGDGRLVLVEAKYSGSALNSEKRVVHECADKVAKWRAAFGEHAVVVALIGGDVKADQARRLQESGAVIVWEHDMGAYRQWLAANLLPSA